MSVSELFGNSNTRLSKSYSVFQPRRNPRRPFSRRIGREQESQVLLEDDSVRQMDEGRLDRWSAFRAELIAFRSV